MKILVIEMSNLGDAILTYPALSALWEKYPGAEMQVLASPRNRALFEGDPRVRRVWLLDRHSSVWGQAALVFRLFRQRFNLVVDFRNSLIPLFLFARGRTPLFRRTADPEHRATRHLSLVTGLGIPPPSRVQPLSYGPEDEQEVRRWLNPAHPVVLIAPGSRSHLKRWSAEGFAEVADRLATEREAQILLVGDAEERPITKHVRGIMRSQAADYAGHTTLRQLAALLSKASLVITNDSAMLHAAGVMGVPTVAIFGPTDERKYGPRGPRTAVVRRSLVCSPCEKALCPYQHECMTLVSPNEVYSAAVRVLIHRDGSVVTPGSYM